MLPEIVVHDAYLVEKVDSVICCSVTMQWSTSVAINGRLLCWSRQKRIQYGISVNQDSHIPISVLNERDITQMCTSFLKTTPAPLTVLEEKRLYVAHARITFIIRWAHNGRLDLIIHCFLKVWVFNFAARFSHEAVDTKTNFNRDLPNSCLHLCSN